MANANLYTTLPDDDFLDTITEFIIEKFSQNNLDNLKVILPNRFACIQLQNKIIKAKGGSCILPNVMPFASISAENDEVFYIPAEDMETINPINEKVILSQIISSYDELSFDVIQALSFAPKLSQLFYEFKVNDISIESINNLPSLNQAKHWYKIYNFLIYAYNELEDKLTKLGKLDKASYQKIHLEAQIKTLEKGDYSIIIAGILGNNKMQRNFINSVSKLNNGYIVLPPSKFDHDILGTNILPEQPLYCLKNLLDVMGKNLKDFQIIQNSKYAFTRNNNFVSLINNHSNNNELLNKNNHNIHYYELENIFEEAEIISETALLETKQNKTIAIIVNDDKSKNIYSQFLLKKQLNFYDLKGSSIFAQPEITFIYIISDFICNTFSIKKLLIILKHPFLYNSYVNILEQKLLQKNRFTKNFNDIKQILDEDNNELLLDWYHKISIILNIDHNYYISNKFNQILNTVVSITQNIYPLIWNHENFKPVTSVIQELLKFDFIINNTRDFPDIFKSILNGTKLLAQYQSNTNIILSTHDNIPLLKFDTVIMANFNEGTWVHSSINPWFNKQMEDKLNLHQNQILSGIAFYNFYLLIHNSKVVITRAKRNDAKDELLPLNYLKRLSLIINLKKQESYKLQMINHDKVLIAPSQSITAKYFPLSISVTDIENLVREPYIFYAKKILNIKKYENINTNPTLAEFGNFIHKVFEEYTKHFNKIFNKNTLKDKLLNIAVNILNQSNLPEIIIKSWYDKVDAISYDFIEFDINRRNENNKIYTEMHGHIFIKLSSDIIKINSIIDRLEVDNQGIAKIIDYKTGSIPDTIDVKRGLSPQLILEALIAIKGNLSNNLNIKQISEISYVKVSSKKPYIEEKKFQINQDELNLQEHFSGLANLLEEYTNNKTFILNLNLAKYNDYKGLMRI